MNRSTNLSPLRLTAALALASVFMGAIGCSTTPRDEGTPKSHRLESRLPSEGSQLGSGDLVVASQQAVAGIADVPEIKDAPERTIIVMDRVGNETSDRTANFQIYLARIRANLNQSGARHNLAFVETRSRAEQIKQREGIPAGEASRTRPNYALTGVFYDMPRGRTNYYLLTFQLVDLTDDIVIWEDSYEVKL
ncbi:MAG: hypothetical protein WD294_16545 [Phycisphaeraceae bacterium]